MAIVGYWRLNGNSNDGSGNSNNGADTNITYSQANGVINGGAGFNNSTSKIKINSSGTLTGTGSHTISHMVKMNGLPGTGDADIFFIKGYDAYTAGWGFFTRVENISGTIKLKTSVVTTSPSLVMYTADAITPDTGKWYHIGSVFDNSNKKLRIFINGVQYGSDVSTGSTLRHSGGCLMGTFDDIGNGYYFNGCLDDVILSNNAWSFAQMKNEYSRIKGFF